jgi:hypothetical protein
MPLLPNPFYYSHLNSENKCLVYFFVKILKMITVVKYGADKKDLKIIRELVD